MAKRNIYLFTIGVRNKPPYKTVKKKTQHNLKIQRASLLFVVVNIDLMCSLV